MSLKIKRPQTFFPYLGRLIKTELQWRDQQAQGCSESDTPLPDSSLSKLEKEVHKREQIIQLMRLCIAAWLQHQGGNKVDLAEKSGLWSVGLDQGRLRTRTLNKYLDVNCLPNRPNFDLVFQTANWVLEKIPTDSGEYKQIKRLHTQLARSLA